MTWFKIIAFVLPAVIAIGGLYFNKPNKPKLAVILSILIIISVLFGIALELKDNESKKQEQDKADAAYKQIETLNKQNKELITGKDEVVAQNKELLGKIENLNNQNEELIAGKDKVIAQNTELLGKIGTYQQDLREKDEKIKELEKKAKMSARGITSIYDFNGNRRETTAGSITLSSGPEREIFKQMTELEKAKNFTALIKLCKKQIEKTPDWLTPYLYLGVAQASMDLKNEAIENFQYVVNNAPGDPEYKQAEEFLKQLKQ